MSQFFTASEADRFTFYRTPKELFTDKFKDLSPLAKLLYGMLLDRNSLSIKNGWLDNNGKVFIIFSREEVQELLCVGKNKPTQLFKELETYDLIQEVRQGVNKPNIIYVKKVYLARTPENRESRIPKNGNQESPKQGGSNTDFNDTDSNKTYNLGNFDKQNPTYDFFSLDKSELEAGIIHYICYYYKITSSNEKYTLEKWNEIFDNLYDVGLLEFESIEFIIDKYIETKFKTHTLYHSTLYEILIHRMQEVGLLSYT